MVDPPVLGLGGGRWVDSAGGGYGAWRRGRWNVRDRRVGAKAQENVENQGHWIPFVWVDDDKTF